MHLHGDFQSENLLLFLPEHFQLMTTMLQFTIQSNMVARLSVLKSILNESSCSALSMESEIRRGCYNAQAVQVYVSITHTYTRAHTHIYICAHTHSFTHSQAQTHTHNIHNIMNTHTHSVAHTHACTHTPSHKQTHRTHTKYYWLLAIVLYMVAIVASLHAWSWHCEKCSKQVCNTGGYQPTELSILY